MPLLLALLITLAFSSTLPAEKPVGLLAAQSANLVLQANDAPLARPGDYVTLAFVAKGSGEFQFLLNAPDGWEPLSNNKTISIEGQRTIGFTVRIPLDALADQIAKFVVTASQNNKTIASTNHAIRVLAVGGVRLRAPDQVGTNLGDPAQFNLFVTNTGNKTDTIRLTAQKSVWQVQIEPASFALEVGETRSVQVRLLPEGQLSSGYIYVLRVRGESSLEAEYSESQVLFRFGSVSERSNDDILQVQANLQVSATPALTLPVATPPIFAFNIGIVPALSGELSDYVSGNLDASGNGFRWDSSSGFQFPNGLTLGFKAALWDTAVRFSSEEIAWSINYALKDWLLSGGVGYRNTSGNQGLQFAASLNSSQDWLRLQLYANFSQTSSITNQTRADTLGANYTVPLEPGLDLNLGADLTGTGANGGYSLGLSLQQSLRWQRPLFEIYQTLTAVPFSGQYGLSLFAGLRDTEPFALRANSALSLTASDPLNFTWRNSAVASLSILEGLGISVSAGYQIATTPQYAITWNIGALATYNLRLAGSLFASLNAGYAYAGTIVGSNNTSATISLGGQISSGNFSVAASGGFVGITSNQGNSETVTANAQLSYVFSSNTALFSTYSYKLVLTDEARENHALTFGWAQVWSANISSSLTYTRTLVADFVQPNLNGDALGIALTFNNVISQGVNLGIGWQWSAPSGSIFNAAVPSQHRFSLTIGFNTNLLFDTPAFITDVFGGRRSGEISGVAFVDDNLNGQRDSGETSLAGVTLRLGRSVSTVTNSDGSYRLRAPVGNYQLDFPAGLEAGMDLIAEREVKIVLNQSQRRDLPFAPVVSLEVSLYDDSNNNGQRDADEDGIPYAGIRIEGPISKEAKVDGEGRVTVSGLVTGVYTVVTDSSRLPDGYRMTTALQRIEITTPNTPEAISIGAALPPRVRETTFEAGNLSVFADVQDNILPAGADLRIEALTQGNITKVTAQVGQTSIELTVSADGRYTGVLRIPTSTAIGDQIVIVTAFSGNQKSQFEVPITVVQGELFVASVYQALINSNLEFNLRTLYQIKNQELELVFPDGQRIKLESTDGYNWVGRWRTPATSGRIEARLEVKGVLLGKVQFLILVPGS